jgi:ankyrin repeat protein
MPGAKSADDTADEEHLARMVHDMRVLSQRHLSLFVRSGPKWLPAAVRAGNTAIVDVLLRHGADVHALNDQALRLAAAYGRTATAEVLLRYGADVNAGDYCPVQLAARSGHIETVERLLQHGGRFPS